eukprot:scaffold294438_cov18-Tisochrysis_lutea.AAC.3
MMWPKKEVGYCSQAGSVSQTTGKLGASHTHTRTHCTGLQRPAIRMQPAIHKGGIHQADRLS